MPALVLVGDADRPEYASAGQYLEPKMAAARLVVVPGGDHSMHDSTHARDVADHVDAFVHSLPPA